MWKITEGARAIDWAILVVDFLVLAVIVWLDAPERFHKHTVRRRLRVVYGMLAQGQKLHQSAPPSGPLSNSGGDSDIATAWVTAVDHWIKQTHQTLAKHSVAAGMAFDARRVAPDLHWGTVSRSSNAMAWYGELLHRLSNLQNIMEKADVYF